MGITGCFQRVSRQITTTVYYSSGKMWNIYVFAICTHGRVPRDGTGSPLAFRCILSCLCDNNVTILYRFNIITVLQSSVTQLLLYFYYHLKQWTTYVCEIFHLIVGLLTFLLNEIRFYVFLNLVVLGFLIVVDILANSCIKFWFFFMSLMVKLFTVVGLYTVID